MSMTLEEQNKHFLEVKRLFTEELLKAKLTEESFNITLEPDEFVYESDNNEVTYDCTFYIKLEFVPYKIEETKISPLFVIFEINYCEGEYTFITGDDFNNPITYGNLFAYLYFDSIVNLQASIDYLKSYGVNFERHFERRKNDL